MVNTCTLQWKYKPCFESPENSVPRLRKPRYRNRHNGSERSRDLHTCQRKPRPGRILDWKTNCKTRLEMFMIAFFKIVFACLKVKRPKYTQIIRVNRSDNVLSFSCDFICVTTGLRLSSAVVLGSIAGPLFQHTITV